ncbi:hypothetical protein L195_g012449 [Trifolium pratense]|uniref:Uncharacterized protein n=1 Tax=Trifolium pratense TaxID=57577 RepID=A0A2K3PKC5_TRIPR|nr:hypothetical protein L195_g012449 [Trifolium pratense]
MHLYFIVPLLQPLFRFSDLCFGFLNRFFFIGVPLIDNEKDDDVSDEIQEDDIGDAEDDVDDDEIQEDKLE